MFSAFYENGEFYVYDTGFRLQGEAPHILMKASLICPVPDENECTDEELFSDLEGGILRLRITNRCPGRCDFCGQLAWSEEERNREMDPRWYFEYLKPIYNKLAQILITGGDAFYSKHSYEYMQFLCNDYPHINIITESDGLTFNEKYRQLAMENLFMTHFSLNASNEDTFIKGCWTSVGGGRGISDYQR